MNKKLRDLYSVSFYGLWVDAEFNDLVYDLIDEDLAGIWAYNIGEQNNNMFLVIKDTIKILPRRKPVTDYDGMIKVCEICDKEFEYPAKENFSSRHYQTCSKSCGIILYNKQVKENEESNQRFLLVKDKYDQLLNGFCDKHSITFNDPHIVIRTPGYFCLPVTAKYRGI